MKTNTLVFHCKETLTGFRKSGIMTVSSITTIAVALLIWGAFLLFHANLDLLLNRLQGQLQINLYLKDQISESNLRQLVSTLKNDRQIANYEIINKQEALHILRKELGTDADLLDNLAINPLPNSVAVTLKPIDDLKAFRKRYQSLAVVEHTSSGQDWVEKLIKLINFSKLIGQTTLVALALASLLIVANTIRLTIFARREEIEIMRLVGATNWFIRIPFLLEGMMQGIIGSLIAILILAFSYQICQKQVTEIFVNIQFVQSAAMLWPLYLKLVWMGIALGLMGSFLSLRKFLV